MSVAISWASKMQLAKCDIVVGFPISSHIYVCVYLAILIATVVPIIMTLFIHLYILTA